MPHHRGEKQHADEADSPGDQRDAGVRGIPSIGRGVRLRDGPEEIFGGGWNGLLVVQELESEIASLEEQTENETEILQASELDGELQQILEQVI